MKKDKQSQINKIFKSIPNKYYYKENKIVEINEGSFFGEIQDVIKFFEKVTKIYEVDKNYEQIKQLDFEELSTEEIGYKDKMEMIENLNKKVSKKELKKNDVVYIKPDYMCDYTYLKSKKETLKEIKIFKSMIEKMETEL